MSNKVLNLDISKDPKFNPIIYGRVGDGENQRVTIVATGRDEQIDLTGWTITFEGETSGGKTKVFDSDNIVSTSEGLKKGTFDYIFPNMAFAVTGKYERAYFSFIKGNVRDTTGDIKIIVLGNADIDAPEAETIITEYNKLVEELRKLQDQSISEMNQNFAATEAKIAALEKQLSDTQSELQQALKDFENGNFWTKDESFNKEESSANVINQIGGTESTIVPEKLLVDGNAGVAARNVNGTITPFSQTDYDNLNSNIVIGTETATNGNAAQFEFNIDVIAYIDSKYPSVFAGLTSTSDKLNKLKLVLKTIKVPHTARGSVSSKFDWWNYQAGSWAGLNLSNTASGFVEKIYEISSMNDVTFSRVFGNTGIFKTRIYSGMVSDDSQKSWIELKGFSLIIELEISAKEIIDYSIAANHVQNLATQDEAENGVSDLKTMTPKRTAEQTLARFGQSFTPSTKFIAHRGNNSFYPENSIAAFEKTSRHWGAETDIQLTTDGKWYCFHDRTLDRMTNGTGNFMDKTSSEIEALRLDTGNGINTLSDVEKKIPTFEQYLNACIKARIVPVIEITPLKTDFTDAQLDSIVTVIRRKGLLNKCVIICFTYEVLVKMRQRMPYTVMHWLISEYSEEMIQKCVINNFVPSFDYSKASVNQALIDKIHDAGLECGLWTVPYNDHQKYSDMGVDYITTDSASGNLRYFEPALRSGMLPNSVDLTGPTYIEETSNGEIHIRVNVTGGQNDVGVYICALESWAIPRHSLILIGYVRSKKVTGFTFVPVSVGVGGYSANDSSIADANIKFGYLTTGTNWAQRDTYAVFDLFYRI